MNKHLNIFTTYTKKNRAYQLENDLSRALAICLQEDALFFHEVLKSIFGNSNLYDQLFEDLDGDTEVQIEIQKQASQINDFEHVYAVSLSESALAAFWQQSHNAEYDPICDLVITINNILIVIEAKRDNVNCTAQLYNQILNIYNRQGRDLNLCKSEVTPFDLNWPKLMAIAVKVSSFEKTTGNNNRFLADFIKLVKTHNFRWLPEPPLGSLAHTNTNAIFRRVESALTQFCNDNPKAIKLDYKSRLGCTFSKGWANELLFKVAPDSGALIVSIYPGNTKAQGAYIFKKTPRFSKNISIGGNDYPAQIQYNIAFRGQSNITGVRFKENDLKKPLYTKENFDKYVGRKKRVQWDGIESLLDNHLCIDWKAQCNWEGKIINSNRTQFDISFGYEVVIRIPYKLMSCLDTNQKEIAPLATMIESIYTAFENDLI